MFVTPGCIKSARPQFGVSIGHQLTSVQRDRMKSQEAAQGTQNVIQNRTSMTLSPGTGITMPSQARTPGDNGVHND